MKFKNIINILILQLVFIITFSGISYASLADWSDEEADKQTQEQLKEQQIEDSNNAGKSSNNFLSTLEIEGYNLIPAFDKQTINYTIDAKDGERINIKATAEDTRATISGIGNVKIEENKNIEINVKAENGLERTYFININKKDEKNNIEENDSKINENEYTAETTSKKIETVGENKKTNNIVILIGIVVVIVIILILLPSKKRKKSKKH